MEHIRVPIHDENGSLVQQRFQEFLSSFFVDNDYSAELTEQQYVIYPPCCCKLGFSILTRGVLDAAS
jgi:hypothetical protein